MSNKIIVPTLGESITEATVSKWLKNQGDPVSSDEPIVELETDKVNVEVPSPSSGTLEKIIIKEGDTVKVGALLGSVSVSKKISSSLKEEKVYDPPIKKNIETNKKIPKIKESQPHKLVEQDYDEKKIFNDEPLILEKETESKIDKPLILDKLHIEEKIEKKAAAQDVQKIKRISLDYGAEVPFLRPKNLSGDKVLDYPVINHVLKIKLPSNINNFFSKVYK